MGALLPLGILGAGYYFSRETDIATPVDEPRLEPGNNHSIELSRKLGRTPGTLYPLTDSQRVTRARYLVGLATADELDVYVRRDDATLATYGYETSWQKCQELYYLLTPHNGGRDPGAPDPADRWSKSGSKFSNRTADCSGGNAWMQGFDRYQPHRFAHIYGGWLNTDSKLIDARGRALAFSDAGYPYPGCIVTCMTGSPGHTKAGHEGTVIDVPNDFAWDNRDSWSRLRIANIGAYNGPANRLTSGSGWYDAAQWTDSSGRRGTAFLRSVMT